MTILFLLVMSLFVFQGKAHAYLDPGTGSYLIQVVIASLAAGTYFFKDKLGLVVGKIKSLVSKPSKKDGKK